MQPRLEFLQVETKTLLVPVARETLADATLHAEQKVAGMSDLHLPGGAIPESVDQLKAHLQDKGIIFRPW